MDTKRQDLSQKNFSKSGPRPHSSTPLWKRTRSNSLSNELDGEEKPSNDGTTTPQPSQKPDVKAIRRQFENMKPVDKPVPYNSHKRTSIPALLGPPVQKTHHARTPPPTAPLNNMLPLENNQSSVFHFHVSQNSKSPSPPPPPVPPRNGTKESLIQKTLVLSMKNVLNNRTNSSSVEESESAPSPTPNTNDSSAMSKDNPTKTRDSVQHIRAIFENTQHFYLPGTGKTDNTASNKPPSSSASQNPHEPPPRPAPRPEVYLKSQVNSWHSMPSFDPADSATGESSISSNQNLSRRTSSESSFTDEEAEFDAQRVKLRKCIEEVHATEKTYVNILYILSVKLSAEVKNTCNRDDDAILKFNSTYKPLLGTIQQIYKLHNELILPEIEEYISGQRTGNMWSIFEKNFKVIEVLYKHYYVTYYDTQGKLDELCRTSSLINEAMLKCQVLLGNLYPITQLNCPNQRLLRYILCLKTYIKHLHVNSDEYRYSRSVHDELDRIAMRCEEELVVSTVQFNELKERLENRFECIKDHRKLLWHGPLKKQSPRRHADIAPRYVILFSDCILVCTDESGRKLDVNRELSMKGITVDVMKGGRTSLMPNVDQPMTGITYYPFRVNAVEKSYEFLVDKESDRDTWVKKIRQASNEYEKRNSTIEVRQSGRRTDEQHKLGDRAPAWINDLDVTRCQNCNNRFPQILISSRRHHCRSCGHCICGSCSTKKLLLEYCKNEGEVRVCDTCYTHFTGTVLSKNTSVWPKPTREVDETILFGDFRTNNSGATVWIALQEDYQLHVYGARLDQAEDYAIKLSDLLDLQLDKDSRTFTLRETTKTHTFSLEVGHKITYKKSDVLDEKLKNSTSNLNFYTDLWFEAIQLARSTTLPTWYVRNRDSSDSGVSNVG
ncbi:unnamed protein product [Adineta ricciae]|uniref:Uncharacterized protein n=1 Tax=Adineta ricciae TaxID=249248 RepID=A0A815YU70_ADIRI|nr:unnamed protein product [Adineta ricciae]